MTPYAWDLLQIAATAALVGAAFLAGIWLGHRSEQEKALAALAYQAEVIHRAYPDATTRALVLRRVADDLGVSDLLPVLDGDPTDRPLVDRVHPGGAYAGQEIR